MSYEVFQAKVNAIINKAGGGIKVMFSSDPDEGKHYAKFPDGTTIVGNLSSLKVSVRWGFDHLSTAAI